MAFIIGNGDTHSVDVEGDAYPLLRVPDLRRKTALESKTERDSRTHLALI